MKYLWMWCLFNSICIVFLAMAFHIDSSINTDAILEIEKMRIELNAYKEVQRDSIVIYNNLEIPKTVNIKIK